MIAFILGGCAALQPLQQRKLIGIFHLIETAKYSDAKIAAEELIADEETAQWPRTWYARGVLCQNAYREGIRRNNRQLTELYPDQLYVALESFYKALALDNSGRMERQIAPRYILLANDFQVMGEKHFKNKEFDDALRAFEQALKISENPILSLKADTNLIHNTALAAFEGKNWEKSIKYFGRLHDGRHSANVAHLLFKSHLQAGDTVAAENTLKEGVVAYNTNQDLVLLLAGLYFSKNNTTDALKVLDEAIRANPENHIFHYTRGLILQKTGLHNEAIEAYSEAIHLAPDALMAYVNMATCYYNLGVEIDENARTIMNGTSVRIEKERSAEAFDTAVAWLDKAYDKNPKDKEVILRLYELYKALRITEKANILERRIR